MEYDTFGEIKVPSDKLWGAQTQRSIENFDICRDTDRMPKPIIRGFAILKKCVARINMNFSLDAKVGEAIVKACDDVMAGKLDDNFPLVVW